MQPNFNPREIKLIIGLGNPGKEYENTYHNVGVLAIEYLAKTPPKPKFQNPNNKLFLFYKNSDIIFVKPLTSMNVSGGAVKEALTYFKVKPVEILVAHDDSDIELGKYKLNFGRGSAGHRGVESIITSLKTKDFWRLRIGIRKSYRSYKSYKSYKTYRLKAKEFVLKKISRGDEKILFAVFEKIAKSTLS